MIVGAVGMVMPTILMAVSLCMAVVALMEEEGEHTQETELGVHVDSHCPLTSGLLNVPPAWPPVLVLLCEGGGGGGFQLF